MSKNVLRKELPVFRRTSRRLPHLPNAQVRNGKIILDPSITAGNKQKRQGRFDPAFLLDKIMYESLLHFPPCSPQTNQPKTEKQHCAGFGDGISTRIVPHTGQALEIQELRSGQSLPKKGY
jgi:hypothetical protein